MLIWSEPFLRTDTLENGRETDVAVLLVDTQGTFDHETSKTESGCLFGLGSTVSYCVNSMSSILIEHNRSGLGQVAIVLNTLVAFTLEHNISVPAERTTTHSKPIFCYLASRRQ